MRSAPTTRAAAGSGARYSPAQGVREPPDPQTRGSVPVARVTSDEKETFDEPDEATQGNRSGSRLDRAPLPARGLYPDQDRQQERDHQRLAGLDAEVESEGRHRQMAGGERERTHGRSEAQS